MTEDGTCVDAGVACRALLSVEDHLLWLLKDVRPLGAIVDQRLDLRLRTYTQYIKPDKTLSPTTWCRCQY